MTSIDVLRFESLLDYRQKTPFYKQSINLFEKDLLRYFLSAGSLSGYNASDKTIDFFYSVLRMALNTRLNNNNKEEFIISNDYINLEPSIKGMVSFILGTISTYAIADKIFNLNNIFHLKDIKLSVTTAQKTPDFFGMSIKNGTINNPVLFEAKGTIAKTLTKSTCERAEKQLKSVQSITVSLPNQKPINFSKSELQMHIIGSVFENKTLKFCDIDPEEDGENRLSFDIEEAILKNYSNIMFLLRSNKLDEMIFNKKKYMYYRYEGVNIGLNKDIYTILNRYNTRNKQIKRKKFEIRDEIKEEFEEKNLFTEISEILDCESEGSEKISLGKDGIIVFE